MKRKLYKTQDQLKELAEILNQEDPAYPAKTYYHQMVKNIVGGNINGYMTKKKARRLFHMEGTDGEL